MITDDYLLIKHFQKSVVIYLHFSTIESHENNPWQIIGSN
jgi:hypothetical protein